MKPRILNEIGMQKFREFLSEFKFNRLTGNLPAELIDSSQFSDEMESDLFIEEKTFVDKFEVAQYLVELFNLQENKNLYYNVGLWSWLSIYYFDQVAPKQADGTRKPGEEARHVLQDPRNHKKYYRHLLAGPARIFSELSELGRIFLTGPLDKRGDLTEQLQAYQNIAVNKGIIAAADKFYWDVETKKLKKGAGSKGKGTPRRFVKIVNQFELTYDLNSMDGPKIIQLFPEKEFANWLKEK